MNKLMQECEPTTLTKVRKSCHYDSTLKSGFINNTKE